MYMYVYVSTKSGLCYIFDLDGIALALKVKLHTHGGRDCRYGYIHVYTLLVLLCHLFIAIDFLPLVGHGLLLYR